MKTAIFAALMLATSVAPALGQAVANRTLTMSGQGDVRAAPDTVTLPG